MEDNEFEEVTIISHTDRPQRVFSEKSIEKLKDQVSLEIVKEINGTEDKTYSDDPRLAPGLRELEKLKQDHFGEGEGKISWIQNIYFISRVAGESGQYLLGAEDAALISTGKTKAQPSPDRAFSVVPWGNHTFVFPQSCHVEIFSNQTGALVKRTNSIHKIFPARSVLTTGNYLYFIGIKDEIIQVDRELNEKTLWVHRDEAVIDFFVCPKTETITTLLISNDEYADSYILKRNEQELVKLRQNQADFASDWSFHILKKMYSDHFLVGETNRAEEQKHQLHLWDAQTYQVASQVEFQARPQIQNIRLLAPRQGISCFLVLMNHSLELFCEYRLKLYHLKTLEISKPLCLASQDPQNGLWMVGCHDSTILSVRVDFSKCPALQL